VFSVFLYLKLYYPVISGITNINPVIPDKKSLRIPEMSYTQSCPKNISAHTVSIGRSNLLLPKIIVVGVVGGFCK
jgi:hypothetical protein